MGLEPLRLSVDVGRPAFGGKARFDGSDRVSETAARIGRCGVDRIVGTTRNQRGIEGRFDGDPTLRQGNVALVQWTLTTLNGVAAFVPSRAMTSSKLSNRGSSEATAEPSRR